MAQSNELFSQYLWLIDTFFARESYTLNELNELWLSSHLNPTKQPLTRHRLARHCQAIDSIFGFEIHYDKKQKLWRMDNMGDLGEGGYRAWLADWFVARYMVEQAGHMRDRVVFESAPAGTRYLLPILRSIAGGTCFHLTYQRFVCSEPHEYTIAPYSLMLSRRRWYVIGKPDNHPEENHPRVYALDRIVNLEMLKERAVVPDDFSTDRYFSDYYGVDTRLQPTEIIIRVDSASVPYIDTLPLHHSQRKIASTKDHADYCFFVAPTIDFCQELYKYADHLTVLSPAWLRQDFIDMHRRCLRNYGELGEA